MLERLGNSDAERYILPIGGRVKSASIGLDRFFDHSGVELDRIISRLRREPCEHMQKAFFPKTGNDLRHMTNGIGLYRPVLKTDQGMPGNFLPFTIDTSLEKSDLSVRSIACEEGVLIPEAWYDDQNDLKFEEEIGSAFLRFDLQTARELLQKIETRRAEKGRFPFMFIRPAAPERPIVFGRDILDRAEEEVRKLVSRCSCLAIDRERKATGKWRGRAPIYFQPDVFILTDGTVMVERLNCPDVGFFLSCVSSGIPGCSPGFSERYSKILRQMQRIVGHLQYEVADRIIDWMGRRITIVTRDDVLNRQEDVLEILEIKALRSALLRWGAAVEVIPVSAVDSVEAGTKLLLLNLDYRSESTTALLRRHAAEEVDCYPNPYFQMVCNEATGLPEVVMQRDSKHCRLLLERASSQPNNDAGILEALRLIDKSLTQADVHGEILHAVLETETVPVLRGALHSWRQLAARARRPANATGPIRLRSIPARPDNLMLTSSTGPRLHTFRFMCASYRAMGGW